MKEDDNAPLLSPQLSDRMSERALLAGVAGTVPCLQEGGVAFTVRTSQSYVLSFLVSQAWLALVPCLQEGGGASPLLWGVFVTAVDRPQPKHRQHPSALQRGIQASVAQANPCPHHIHFLLLGMNASSRVSNVETRLKITQTAYLQRGVQAYGAQAVAAFVLRHQFAPTWPLPMKFRAPA